MQVISHRLSCAKGVTVFSVTETEEYNRYRDGYYCYLRVYTRDGDRFKLTLIWEAKRISLILLSIPRSEWEHGEIAVTEEMCISSKVKVSRIF